MNGRSRIAAPIFYQKGALSWAYFQSLIWKTSRQNWTDTIPKRPKCRACKKAGGGITGDPVMENQTYVLKMPQKDHTALENLCAFCRSLGAHVREVQDGASFTAMLWEDADSVSERDATEIQRKIRRKTAEYPGFVCYCFDAFSTLIYRV